MNNSNTTHQTLDISNDVNLDISDINIDNNSHSSLIDKVHNSIKEFASLSTLLRTIGALLVVAAMSMFLLQEWTGGDDLRRFYLLLGQTLLLALSGFGLSFLLKENKGGRAFFGLSLISITANITTLGALIFSVTQWGGSLSTVPDMASWTLGAGSLWLTLLGAASIILPIALFCFSVMARQSAAWLTGLFIFTNSLLLIPVRDALSISLIAAIGISISYLTLRKHINNTRTRSYLLTWEGRFAIASIFTPLVIILARSVWLYPADEVLFLMFAAIIFLGLHISNQKITKSFTIIKRLLEITLIIVAAFIALIGTSLISDLLIFHFSLSSVGIIFSALILFLAYHSQRHKEQLIALASLSLTSLNGLQLLALPELTSTLLCIASGISILVLANITQKKYLLVIGAMTMMCALVYQCSHIFSQTNLSNWVSMTGIGISAIIAASLLERYGATLKLKWSQWGN